MVNYESLSLRHFLLLSYLAPFSVVELRGRHKHGIGVHPFYSFFKLSSSGDTWRPTSFGQAGTFFSPARLGLAFLARILWEIWIGIDTIVCFYCGFSILNAPFSETLFFVGEVGGLR